MFCLLTDEVVYFRPVRMLNLKRDCTCCHQFIHCNLNFHPGKNSLRTSRFVNFLMQSIRGGFCSGLKDPTGNRLTLVYPGGKMYRISVPFISECPFVTKCLVGLKQVLMKDVAIQVKSHRCFVENFFLNSLPSTAHGKMVCYAQCTRIEKLESPSGVVHLQKCFAR